jgi:metal-responsive CopG/Arc/MetJ family transcriptional regulator
MSDPFKKRMGEAQKQFIVYVEADLLREFDALVGKGNRSLIVRDLMYTYIQAKQGETS